MKCKVMLIAMMAAATVCQAGGYRWKDRKPDTDRKPDKLSACPQPEPLVVPRTELLLSSRTVGRPSEIDNRIKGIDISHHQGRIDWSRVAADPQVNYCFIKATESNNFVDERYQENLKQARAHGIKVGAYHFFSHRTQPTQQANNMIATVKLDEQDIVPMIDVETIGRRADVNAFRKRLKTFLQIIERHYGIRPLIYTGENFYNHYLAGHFTDYRFMIAKYREPEPRLKDKNTVVLMWQYSCTGEVDGINGDCDQSCFLKDYNINDILIKR